MRFLQKLMAVAAAFLYMCGIAEAQTISREQLIRQYSGFSAKDFAEPKKLPITVKEKGGRLIYSDCPEYVKKAGILYSDIVEGDTRLFYYHLNDSERPMKVAAIVEAVDEGTFVRIKRGVLEPVVKDDYCALGRGTQVKFYSAESQRNDILFVSTERRRLLAPEMNRMVLNPGDLTEGVYDFSADNKVKVTVIMYPAEENPFEFLKTAEKLTEEKELRQGTFPHMDRVLRLKKPYMPRKDGIACVTLADNGKDYYCRGVDADRNNKQVVNYGNYGVNYHVVLPVRGEGKTHYYLESLGGAYSGAVLVHHGFRSRNQSLILTPDYSQQYMGHNGEGEYVDLGSYDNTEQLWLEFSPPGASNLPVRIVMVPEMTGKLAPNAKRR